MKRSLLVVATMVAAIIAACSPKKPNPDPSADAGAAVPSPTNSVVTPVNANGPGDPAKGKELVGTFQCNRCHEGTGHASAPQNKHCVQCHKDIMEDRFSGGTAASMARWKPRVKEYADAPSLEATGKRFSRKWVENYLLAPTDLRPHLHQFMPRLDISKEQAKDIAAYLVPDADGPASTTAVAKADLGKGRQLLESKGCGACHAMTGVAAVPSSNPPAMGAKEFDRAHKLAPDLRFARDRMSADKMIAWLKDPKAVKADSAMPKIALTDAEIVDVAGYLLTVELAAPPPPKKIERLPVLTRKVTFKEVDEKVFHRTCWHCHSEPDYAIGDGGPGNSGGLGFKPKGLNLSDYNGIAAGFLDEKGERASVFTKEDKTGIPRLVLALTNRHEEVNGNDGPVRGMPLGYDPLPLEDIQLVESWIAQGRPR
jgi:mono/diheme cytochrome c family protein